MKRKYNVFCSSGCGANFTAPTGRVVSPNYPADYPDNSNCNYTIDAGEQTMVVIVFKIFQVEGKCLCINTIWTGNHLQMSWYNHKISLFPFWAKSKYFVLMLLTTVSHLLTKWLVCLLQHTLPVCMMASRSTAWLPVIFLLPLYVAAASQGPSLHLGPCYSISTLILWSPTVASWQNTESFVSKEEMVLLLYSNVQN